MGRGVRACENFQVRRAISHRFLVLRGYAFEDLAATLLISVLS